MIRKTIPWLLFILLLISFLLFKFDTSPVKLAIGIVGTLLVFGAEVLYSLRKSGFLKFGKTAKWLKVHVAIGIIGPLFILYHSNLNFSGFSGVLLLLTIVVVISGFFGRYVYKLIPKTIKGREVSLTDLKKSLTSLRDELEILLGEKYVSDNLIINPNIKNNNIELIFKTGFEKFHKKLNFKKFLHMRIEEKGAYINIRRKYDKIISLDHQISMYYSAKHIFKQWKLLHIPLTATLFVMIITHVCSVLYYGRIY